MGEYWTIFIQTIEGMISWIIQMVTFQVPWNQNWFYGLVVLSLLVWTLEILFPWRKEQKLIRKDFWLDAFYMFFNFFLFAIVLESFYKVLGAIFAKFGLGIDSIALFDKETFPNWLLIILFFILNDFVQWFTHVLLHRYNFLWKFHQVHHSVEEMGFAAHLRYHWMENLFYKPLKTFVVMIFVGAEPIHAFYMHFFAIAIGHLNHANVRITWGPLKYIFNNSVMHLYHHAKELPHERKYGVNFGISLSLWDYLFKTDYIPQSDDGNYALGFEKIEKFPKTFWKQFIYGITPNKNSQ